MEIMHIQILVEHNVVLKTKFFLIYESYEAEVNLKLVAVTVLFMITSQV